MQKKSFTLIELILVVGIVAVLAGAMVPMILSARQKAREARAMADLEALRVAFRKYNADTGREDISINWLVYDPPAAPIPGWAGPYITEAPVDPWGNSYHSWGMGGGGMSPKLGFASYGPNGVTNFCGLMGMPSDDVCILAFRQPPP